MRFGYQLLNVNDNPSSKILDVLSEVHGQVALG